MSHCTATIDEQHGHPQSDGGMVRWLSTRQQRGYRRLLYGLTLVLSLLVLTTHPAQGQEVHSRFGAGLQFMGSTAVDGAGPGLHLRASFPMNYELSFAMGSSLTGFVLQGASETMYALGTDASLVVTLPNPSKSSLYLLGGAGYHFPLQDAGRYEGVDPGPTFHVGLGKVWNLGSTALYVELTPTLFFRRDRTDVLFPLRGGLIL